jgi:hypothetical protein
VRTMTNPSRLNYKQKNDSMSIDGCRVENKCITAAFWSSLSLKAAIMTPSGDPAESQGRADSEIRVILHFHFLRLPIKLGPLPSSTTHNVPDQRRRFRPSRKRRRSSCDACCRRRAASVCLCSGCLKRSVLARSLLSAPLYNRSVTVHRFLLFSGAIRGKREAESLLDSLLRLSVKHIQLEDH